MKYLNRKSKNYWNLKKKPELWTASNKRDGLFAHMERGTGLVSRDGNPFPGFGHIEEEINQLFRMNRNITHIQCELYTDEYPFQELQGIIRKGEDERKMNVKACIFTIGGLGDPTHHIDRLIGEDWVYLLPISEFWTISDVDVEDEVKEAIANGFEGLVLRKLRDDGIIYKAKTNEFHEMDLIIVDFEEGKGHLVGYLGKVHCVGEIDGQCIEVKIGGGFKKSGTLDSREALWKLALEGKLINQKLEAAHEGLTEPNKDGICSLRFGKFVKMKEDR